VFRNRIPFRNFTGLCRSAAVRFGWSRSPLRETIEQLQRQAAIAGRSAGACCLIAAGLLMAIGCMVPAADAADAADGPRNSSILAFSDDGTLLACSNRDSGSVTILTWPALQKKSEIPVGRHPEGIAWIPGSHRLACCVYSDDQIVVLDADSAKTVHRIDVFDEPYGLVAAPDGRHLYATLEYPGQLIKIDCDTWKIIDAWDVAKMPRGIAIAADGRSVFITEYLTAWLRQVSTVDGSELQAWKPASTDNLARQVVLSPAGDKAYMTHIRSRVAAAHGNGSIFPYVSTITLAGERVGRRVRIPMDTFRGAQVTANPWDCDVSSDGQLLYVAFSGTEDMYVARVTKEYQELEYENRFRLGSNPRAVRVAPDDKSIVVYNTLDFEVVRMSAADGSELARVQVTENPLPADVLMGKKLFYTARQPMSVRQWIACSSCHVDGDADGRTWQQPEGKRNTQPLFGLAWTHPLHWSADRDEVHDFEHTIRGPLMQGQGLLRGELPDALGEPISARSKMLDALAAYTNSHEFKLSPHAKGGLSESARRGQQLFNSDRTGCRKCHTGPFYTDSRPVAVDDFVRHDVGTGRGDDTELMGFEYDTPTLLGVYRSAPYLHDGTAPTLLDVLTTANPRDQHGRTSHLSEQELQDLVEFLKALPFEDPTRSEGIEDVISVGAID
jgi:DNA-binding beta-propeller fold protein YncE